MIALTGGDTPRRLYELLAGPPYREGVEWPRLVIFFTDERQVPPGDPRSNVQMASETLLDRVPIAPEHVHRPRMDDPDLARAAADYAALVNAHVPRGAQGWPVFDLILLGMGADGHTASLFPGDPVLDENRVPVAAVDTPHAGFRRITLTLPVLNAARRVCFWFREKRRRRRWPGYVAIRIPRCRQPACDRPRGRSSGCWTRPRRASSAGH